jgi:hypothetical protein
VKRIRVHILTDGRDVLDGSSVGFVEIMIFLNFETRVLMLGLRLVAEG